ncbi:MAG TPA: alpha/beta hydrolase [Actinomycetota bacterium]|nr:alpha/beta hydrolase [Actinomycetota bacterium]
MSFVDASTQIRETGGQGFRVFDAGSGTPVVVLHGWGGRIESMAPVLRCLMGEHRVVALDLPGFGDSPLPAGVWGTPDYAAFVRDALKDLGIERAHFVGHSYGAKTSLYLAATHPDLVDKLVLAGSSGLRTPPSLQARMKRLVSKGARFAGKLGPAGRALRARVYERIASQDYRDAGELRPILVRVVNEDLTNALPRVGSSTLLVWGTEDDAAPVAHARIMERSIPDAGLVLFEGAGHFAYLDEPDRFCRVVRHFLGDPEPADEARAGRR